MKKFVGVFAFVLLAVVAAAAPHDDPYEFAGIKQKAHAMRHHRHHGRGDGGGSDSGDADADADVDAGAGTGESTDALRQQGSPVMPPNPPGFSTASFHRKPPGVIETYEVEVDEVEVYEDVY